MNGNDAIRGGSVHTPGPWLLDERYPGKVYCDDATGSIVADCGPFKFALRRTDAIEANARLIAAAPDLLAACKDAQERLAKIATMMNGRDEGVYMLAYDGLQRAAIRTATHSPAMCSSEDQP